MPSQEILDRVYASMQADHWQYTEPIWWHWSREAIDHWAPDGKVLDIGCFRGDFLGYLGSRYARFGVEPNEKAAAVARARGIQIVGSTLANADQLPQGSFGAAVLMDVVEHVYDPRRAVALLMTLLRPGGVIILLTGNSDSWPARLSLPFYWYLGLPYHLVYLNRRYVMWLASELGLDLVAWRTLAHEKAPWSRRIRQSMGCGLYASWHHWIERSPMAGIARRIPPYSSVAPHASAPPLFMRLKDHFWAVLRKPLTGAKSRP